MEMRVTWLMVRKPRKCPGAGNVRCYRISSANYSNGRGRISVRSAYSSFYEDIAETTLRPVVPTTTRYINGKGSTAISSDNRTSTNNKSSDGSSLIFRDVPDSKYNLDPRKRNKIPLDFWKKFSHETDIIQVFENYVSNVQFKIVDGQKYLVNADGIPIEAGLEGPNNIGTTSEKPVVKPFGGFSTFTDRNMINKPTAMANEERIASNQVGTRIIKPALCEPEMKTVEVPKPSDPNIIQFPRCVRLERCGGCCGSDLLTCEPLRQRATEVQVQKFHYNDEIGKLEYNGTEVVVLPSHLECRCNCLVKASDCSVKHSYSSNDCLCTCKNRGEQDICLHQSHKLWDPNLCQCICREIKACATGMSFNLETCECAAAPEPKGQKDRSNRNQRNARNRQGKRGL